MSTSTLGLPELASGNHSIDPNHLGLLRESNDALDDVAELHRRMDAEGYLLLRQLVDRTQVLEARRLIAAKLQAQGHLAPDTDPLDCIARPGSTLAFKPDLADGNAPLMSVVYAGALIDFFARYLGGPVRHYDYTWMRAVAPGKGTPSHCDVVYMGRGTRTSLHTTWTPLGDIDFVQGGLMVLEGSNNNQRLKETYGQYDVDSFCENRPEINGWKRGGHLSPDPNQIQRSVGGRWLSTEYRAGDVLIFTPFTVHASLDNRSKQIRLSSDTRYQRADEPADERWVGEKPIGHSQAGKRGRIC